MHTVNGDKLPTQQVQEERHCPRCNRQRHLLTTLRDTRTGKTVRIFRCPQCGEITSAEEAADLS
jgi:transcription elongation factor Elf1